MGSLVVTSVAGIAPASPSSQATKSVQPSANNSIESNVADCGERPLVHSRSPGFSRGRVRAASISANRPARSSTTDESDSMAGSRPARRSAAASSTAINSTASVVESTTESGSGLSPTGPILAASLVHEVCRDYALQSVVLIVRRRNEDAHSPFRSSRRRIAVVVPDHDPIAARVTA